MKLQELTPDHKIGITLSGGGARGAAHIGVLRALAEYGIYPNHVVGVSSGAIVGVLYCAGMSADEMMEIVAGITVIKVVKLGIPRTGLTSMDYLRERLRFIAPDNDFSKLQRKLSVGATNLNTGKFQLFSEGPLHEPIAASCSIPFVFKPVLIENQLFVDGGIMCNMPVDPIQHEVDFLIGSNLIPDSELPLSDLSSVISISWRTFDLSVRANSASCQASCDLWLEPPELAQHNIFSLKKIKEIHDIGYTYTKAKLAQHLSPSFLRNVTD